MIGSVALGDAGWRREMRLRLQQDVGRLDRLLAAAELKVRGGTLLFRLAEGQSGTAEKLGRAGILVRAFLFNERWFRFGIPRDEQTWERLAQALRN